MQKHYNTVTSTHKNTIKCSRVDDVSGKTLWPYLGFVNSSLKTISTWHYRAPYSTYNAVCEQ